MGKKSHVSQGSHSSQASQASQAWIKKGSQVLAPTYARFPLVLTRGSGAVVYDADNKRYLDFVGGIAVNVFGHSDRKLVQAISVQAKRLLHVSNLYYTIPPIQLAAWLTDHSFADSVFFANSGAEANEAAIKLARKFAKTIDPGRFEIISAFGSFHGRTLATVAATGQEKYHKGFEPLPEGFKHVSYDDIAALEKGIGPHTAAVLLEPIQGEGGVRIPKPDYLAQVRALCDRYSLLLILDEVQTGMGRTGSLFAYEPSGIVPDILTLAKGLGGGFPIGAMLAKKEIMQVFTPGTHASTFGGNPFATATSLAVVKRLTPVFLKGVKKKGGRLLKALTALQKQTGQIKDLRGQGLLIALDLASPALEIIERAREQGLLLSRTSETTIRLTPPLTVSDDQIARAVSILAKVFNAQT